LSYFRLGKERLGTLVDKKKTSCVCLTDVIPAVKTFWKKIFILKKDKPNFDLLREQFRKNYNENIELRKNWGGGVKGMKTRNREEKFQKQLQNEQLKKANL